MDFLKYLRFWLCKNSFMLAGNRKQIKTKEWIRADSPYTPAFRSFMVFTHLQEHTVAGMKPTRVSMFSNVVLSSVF